MSLYPKFHGIMLANNAVIENLQVERLAADPMPATAGRIWVNTTEKKLKFTGLDATGAVVVHSFSSGSELTAALTDAKAYTDAQIIALQGTAPEVLNTLGKIAEALNNDPNLYDTLVTLLTNSVAQAKADVLGTATQLNDTLGELEVNLTREVADRATAVTTEANQRNASDTALGNRIDGVEVNLTKEVADRTAADAALDGRLTTVEAQASGKTGDLSTLTTTAKGDLVSAINEVDADLAAEVLRAQEAEGVLTSAVSTEAAARTAADVVLQTQVGQIDLLNTESRDLVSAVNEVLTAVTDEASRAQDAESVVASDLATEVARAKATEGLLGALTTENKSSLVGAINFVNASLASEVSDRVAADTALTSAVAAEAARAEAAEGVLQSNIDTEATARVAETARATAAEGVLTSAVAAEVTRAKAAEAVLQTNVDAEATARATADATLTTVVATEVARAQAAEAVLQTNINNAGAAGSQAVVDEAAARTAADAAIKTAINAGKFTFTAPTAALTHTVAHGLNTSPVLVSVYVEGDDGVYRNDIVAVEETNNNTITVGLTESRRVKVAVLSLATLV